MRAWTLTLIGTLGLWASATNGAGAQELGREGNLVFGAERLAGFYLGERSIDFGPVETEVEFSSFALLWDRPPTPLNRPRLTVDYFVTNEVSIGGGLGFFAQDVGSGAADEDLHGLIFVARGGYALRLSHSIFFWPRGGLVYYNVDFDTGGDWSLLAFEVEGMFSLAPADGWAFLVGPSLDLGLTGEAGDNDMTEYSFGVAAAFVGWVEL